MAAGKLNFPKYYTTQLNKTWNTPFLIVETPACNTPSDNTAAVAVLDGGMGLHLKGKTKDACRIIVLRHPDTDAATLADVEDRIKQRDFHYRIFNQNKETVSLITAALQHNKKSKMLMIDNGDEMLLGDTRTDSDDFQIKKLVV